MFYSYRKFKKTSKKGVYILVIAVFILIAWAYTAYTGVNITPRLITQELPLSIKCSYDRTR